MDKKLNYVRFDVGHHLHVCHKSTLMRFEDSVLAKYISPNFDRRTSEMDYITIDRDGKHFGSILNYMRDPNYLDLATWSSSDLKNLLREADFYCISDLVELCDNEFAMRERKIQEEKESNRETQREEIYSVPASSKLEVIYGYDTINRLLQSTEKPVIVVSYRSMRKFHIDAWIEELVKMSDHSKFKICCFADKPLSNTENVTEIEMYLSNFIIKYFDSQERKFTLTIPAPDYDKFRNRRNHYKLKIFRCWLIVLYRASRSIGIEHASSPNGSFWLT